MQQNIFEVQPKLKKLWWWSAGLMQWRAAMSLRPMQKNLRIVDQNFNQELQFFCMKLEVALNCNTDHSIYLSISLIRKPKLFEAIWWWTETLAAKCLTWIETWKQTYCVSWESSHNQNDWSGAHQSSREYPYLSMIQGLAGWQQINQSTNHILRWERGTSTCFLICCSPRASETVTVARGPGFQIMGWSKKWHAS